MSSFSLRILHNSLWLAIFFGLAACTGSHQSSLRHLIPLPPDTPRIEWLGTYSDESDFPNFTAKKRLEYLTGVPVKTPLKAPTGIAGDGEGKVFVGDLLYENILVFDLKKQTLKPLLAESDLRPRQIVLDSSKKLYVADSRKHMVRVFSRDGEELQSYGNPKELDRPLGVAVDEIRKRVYVSDGASNQVKVFDQETAQQLFTIGTGSTTTREGDLYNPAGLAIDKDGHIYVVEHLNARISVFDADGTFLKFVGGRDSSTAGFENPRALAIDSEGNLWVVDFRRPAIRAYDQEGRLLFSFQGPPGDKLGFSAPAAIAIDSNDEIYVADLLAARFSHWRYLSKLALARHPISEQDLSLAAKALEAKQAEDVSPLPAPPPK